MNNLLERLEAARFEIVELTHDKWQWVAEVKKDGMVGKGYHPKKQGALQAAHDAWRVQKALQTIEGEPPTLGAKTSEHLAMKDRVR